VQIGKRLKPIALSIRKYGEPIVKKQAEVSESPRCQPEYHEPSLPCDKIEFPIVYFGIPQDQSAFVDLAKHLAERLKAGQNVLIHCAAGIGRTGTLAVSVLISLGSKLDQALEAVQHAGSHPETTEGAATAIVA
jgi:protein tyrosine phosphatase